MTASIDGPTPASAPEAARPLTPADLPRDQGALATEFETAVFDAAVPTEAAAATALPQMTVENIVRMFCVSSLYREAFNTQEWGK